MGPSSPLPSRRELARRPRRRLAVALRRQPVLFWASALVAAGAAYVSVDTALGRAADGADAYGEVVTVAVASRPIEAGEVVAPGDVTLTEVAERLVPPDAVSDPPEGRVARAGIAEGEAVVASRLAPDGSVGIAAQLEPDERAVAVPTDHHRAPLEAGQRVDVLATVDPTLAAGRSPTAPVTEGARVLAVSDDGVTVAVGAGDAERLATALATAVVTVVVAPG